MTSPCGTAAGLSECLAFRACLVTEGPPQEPGRTSRSAPYFGLTVTEIVFGLSCWLSVSVDAPGADVTVAPVAETV